MLPLYKASEILVELADKEKRAMNILLDACQGNAS